VTTTTILDLPSDISSRLASLGLNRNDLLQVVLEAAAAKNEAVSIDPINAPGLLAYIYGTRSIRRCLLPNGWEIDRSENIEATLNPVTGTRLIYQNCDVCCDSLREPKAISAKGAAAGRLVDNHNADLFPELLEKTRRELNGNVWFLCVSIDGDDVRAELSCPGSIDGRQFGSFIERIYLVRHGDFDPDLKRNDERSRADGNSEDYEVIITRK